MDDAGHTLPADPNSTGTDWSRLANMSDEDIARAVEADPDAAPILDGGRLGGDYRPHVARLVIGS